TIFPRGKPATLASVLDGDPAKQKEALWSYFALGKAAPGPKPPPPQPVPAPLAGEAPLVAQIPVRPPGGEMVESLCLLSDSHDLTVYARGVGPLRGCFTGAQILRAVQGRLRTYTVAGTAVGSGFAIEPSLQLIGGDKPEGPENRTLHGYDRLADGARLRWRVDFASGTVELSEILRLGSDGGKRRLLREVRFTDLA